jgi:hypothetical protein
MHTLYTLHTYIHYIHTYITCIHYIHHIHTLHTYIHYIHTYITCIHYIHYIHTYITYIHTLHTYIHYMHSLRIWPTYRTHTHVSNAFPTQTQSHKDSSWNKLTACQVGSNSGEKIRGNLPVSTAAWSVLSNHPLRANSPPRHPIAPLSCPASSYMSFTPLTHTNPPLYVFFISTPILSACLALKTNRRHISRPDNLISESASSLNVKVAHRSYEHLVSMVT